MPTVPLAVRGLVIWTTGHVEMILSITRTEAESVALAVPLVQFMVSVVVDPTAGYQGWLGPMGPSDPFSVIPETPDGEVNWQAVALPDAQVKFQDSPLNIVTSVSEPFIFISAVTVVEEATTPITTESVALLVPLVQLIVSVVEAVSVGYHGWLGAIGPSFPESVIPETPDGDVS